MSIENVVRGRSNKLQKPFLKILIRSKFFSPCLVYSVQLLMREKRISQEVIFNYYFP